MTNATTKTAARSFIEATNAIDALDASDAAKIVATKVAAALYTIHGFKTIEAGTEDEAIVIAAHRDATSHVFEITDHGQDCSYNLEDGSNDATNIDYNVLTNEHGVNYDRIAEMVVA